MQIINNLKKASLAAIAVIAVVVIVFIGSFFIIIDAGQVGVVSTFGSVSDSPLQPGFHIKNPFASVTIINTRTQSYTMSASYGEGEVVGDDSIQALAKDGGSVWFDVTVLYRVKSEEAPRLFKELGLNYNENIIRPEIRSNIRAVGAQYTVNELYSTKRDEAQASILSRLQEGVNPRGIEVESVLLRKVNISETLSNSIEEKLAAEQAVQKEQFEIDKAKKVAERKIIEAEGQKQAQEIISKSLSSNYLYYLYISQLKERQGVIYVPLDPNNGLPIFKNVD